MSAEAPGAITFEPLFIVLGCCAAWVYATRGGPRPRWRRAAFAAGVALGTLAVNSPLETVAERYLLSAHLLQNALIGDWAPPLIILGLAPADREAVARCLGRSFRILTKPGCALGLWLVAWYSTHLPLIYDAALRHTQWLNLEHLVLMAAGFLFWWPVISDAPHRLPTTTRLAMVVTGGLALSPLGFALALSHTVFYGYYLGVPRLWGVSPIADQNIAGIFMNVEQSVIFLAAVAWLFTQLLEDESAPT